MVKMARRDFIKGLGLAGAAAGIASFPGFFAPETLQIQNGATLGTVVQIRRGPVTFHTYVAPEVSSVVTTHIIETENRVVVVDTQLLQTFARDVRAYIDSLGKPIERVFLSHEHPDHWLGANNFADAPFYATANTITNVNASIQAGTVASVAAVAGESEVPEVPNAPTEAITVESETIDGVAFEYAVYTNHEAAESVMIKLPETNTLIVQDLLYNNVHFFPGQDRANWSNILGEVQAIENYDMLLVGHGFPTTFGELDLGIDYLTFVQDTLPTVASADELISALRAEYPSFGGQGLVAFWGQFFPAS